MKLKRKKLKFTMRKKRRERVVSKHSDKGKISKVIIEITEKLCQIKKIINPGTTYNAVKYKDTLYKIGDHIICKSNRGNIVGKLTKIVPYNGIEKYSYWPSIKINIYKRKIDINREKNGLEHEEKFDSLSEYEVFKTEDIMNVFIETIISKCSVKYFY